MLDKQEQLGMAIRIATLAHEDQFDKGGKPYILHPLHLMQQMLFDTELAIIAVLHDVPEDSDLTIEDLVSVGFSQRVTDALALLTHHKSESYEEYIDMMLCNYDCIRVKRKDLAHNSSITRLKGVGPKDLARMEKYHKAFLKLGEARSKHVKVSDE